jgi:tRNA nucleotidyltransferase (CCA-adding enzyme)
VVHEVTTFRRDVRTDGRHAEVEFGASLDEDLARRDFTINAIAYSPQSGALHDPFDGRGDLARGIVRAVGQPEARMREDRLRALRALRFAGRFGFEIEPATWQAIADSAPYLTRLSRERVRQELEKVMAQVRQPSRSLLLWRKSGALASLVPGMRERPDVVLHAPDAIGLPDATRHAARASARASDRVAAIFMGLPADVVRRILRDLRFSNRQVDWVGDLAGAWDALHDDVTAAVAAPTGPDDATIRHWVARTGRTAWRSFHRILDAHWSAERAFGREVPAAARSGAVYRRSLRIAFRDPIAVGDLAIDGDDLRRLGIPPGPGLGALLARLLEFVLEDPRRNDRVVLLEQARAWNPGAVR